MMGSPHYIAPEQISNARKADIRADIYSLGCTLYYLLAGRAPFPAETLYDILQAHMSMDARTLNLVRTEVPSDLAALVAKLMAKARDQRFQTADDVSKSAGQALSKRGKAGNQTTRKGHRAGRC